MFSSAQAPFLVTETNAQSIGQSHWETIRRTRIRSHCQHSHSFHAVPA
jgi:hypothetical protein